MPEKDRTLSLLPDEVPSPAPRQRWSADDALADPLAPRAVLYARLKGRGARGATDAELAAELGIPEGTARGRLCELTYQTDPPLAFVSAAEPRGHQVVVGR